MLTSVAWLNKYLDPATVSPDEAEHVLTNVGFPIESREEVPAGGAADVGLDVELTSNRGDCLCHLGLAREIAAATGRKLVTPALKGMKTGPTKASEVTSVENQLAASGGGGGGCPRFTARVIRNVTIGPSPAWLARSLEAVGQRPINNVVDITNFINLELGHPSHVFDLDALAGRRLVVRYARPNEPVVALDGRKHVLRPDEMVVADADKAVSIAGVIGGLESGVTQKTKTVLLEMATWDPVTVRRAARRLDIRTDASHRFERYVDARDIDFASARGAELIAELTGGELLEGMIDAGALPAPRSVVSMRAERCHHLLGIRVPTADMVRLLQSIGIGVSVERHGQEERLRCVIPPHRHDLTREVDLIEEVARLHGFDKITLAPMLDVHLEHAHPGGWERRERAMQILSEVLAGSGFFETVTFSFITKREAERFRPVGKRLLHVEEERRKGAPYLRPSIVPNLLSCRRSNQDGQVRAPGGVRLYECASIFAEDDDGAAFGRRTIEMRNVCLLADAPEGASNIEAKQGVVRTLRGVIDALTKSLGGPAMRVEVEPARAWCAALEEETLANVSINGVPAGYVATVSKSLLTEYGLERPVGVAEVCLTTLLGLYPPTSTAAALPKFPSIERDLSVIVDEDVPWAKIDRAVREISPALMETLEFVGTYRGKQIGAGKKSVTLRMVFRDPERTLRHEEVDPQVASVVKTLASAVGGELRGPVGA